MRTKMRIGVNMSNSKRHQQALKIALVLVVGGLGIVNLFEGQRVGAYPMQVDDYASLSGKQERSTEVGKAVPSEQGHEKEVEVLLKDPAMSQKWGLLLTDAERAWKVTRGDKGIVVAVIDTGIDVKHPDLKANLWINRGESGTDKNGNDKATNGVDDDDNGFVDDIHGWNFVGNDPSLTDNHGHGTHIAGIIGAEGGNGIGISGVSPNVSLMTLKYYDPKAPGLNNLMNTVRAIRYATAMGAHIINYSGGGLEPSDEERKAIEEAKAKGILVVAAAGNEKSNSDIHSYYPADYPLSNIISVTAIDKEKNVLPSSNYGELSVDLAAPGNDIFSTLPQGQYGYMTGTSQATAFVTGVAALLMASNQDLRKPERLIKYLTQTGDTDERLAGKTRYKKRLNSYKALVIKDADESLNGVIVENTQFLPRNQFTADASNADPGLAQESQLAQQTKDILKHLGHVNEDPRLPSQVEVRN